MLAAAKQYSPAMTYLLMGGLSKGVNRSDIFTELPESVQEVICFGAEAETLCNAAILHGHTASAHKNLSTAFAYTIQKAAPGSVILLSPSGSSFDLYKNYEERGNHFKQLVQQLRTQKDCA